MKLKKLTAFALTAAVAASSFASITAFADNNTTDIGGTVKNNTSSYTMTIPAGNTSMDLTQNTYNSVGTLKVVRTEADKTAEVSFDTGKKVSVTVSHADVLTNTDTNITANNTLAYKLVKGDTADSDEIANNGVIVFSASEIDAETGVNIGAVVKGDSTQVENGTYKDTITFTASVADARPEYYDKLTSGAGSGNDQVSLLKDFGRGYTTYNSSLTAAQAYALATYQAAIDGKVVYVIMSSQDSGYEIHYSISTDTAATEHVSDLYDLVNNDKSINLYYVAQ